MEVSNVYFELTRAFNANGRIAILGSGQAVVHHRLAIMSKDGDWILREDPEACRRVLDILADRGAWYRPGAPLDVRWLAEGWSSHLELRDDRSRRVRCDFFTRPPRLPKGTLEELFDAGKGSRPGELAVVGVEELILLKRTQRAKDYPIIGELARRLPPEREIELTTDPGRILELAPRHGAGCPRPAVQEALRGAGRRAVVVALAEEIDRWQLADRDRLRPYEVAARRFLESVRELSRQELSLPEGHSRLVALAERYLPLTREEPP